LLAAEHPAMWRAGFDTPTSGSQGTP